MVTISAKKRLNSIERDIIPSMFVGVLSKDDDWIRKTIENTLPSLENRALHLAQECKKNGECNKDDKMCDEDYISALFKDAREKLEKEHLVRKAHSRFHH